MEDISFLFSENKNNIVSPTNEESIVLVCAADDNYAMPLAVMVRSVLENLGSERHLSLFIIDGGIKQHNKQKITRSINSERVEVKWLQPLTDLLDGLEGYWYITIAMFYRLLIPDLLPQYQKAIYLDTDLILNEDLGKLWDIDIGEDYLLAVGELYPSLKIQELTSSDISSTATIDCPALQLPINFKAFNSGVLVINLEKWRAENLGRKIIEYLVTNRPYGRTTDGDGLNIMLRNRWKAIDPRWNQTPGIYEYQSRQDSSFSAAEFQNIVDNPYIIHFAHPGKPWNTRGQHPAESLFYHYLDLTAWSGWRFTLWKRIQRKLLAEIKQIGNRISFAN